MFTSVQDVTQAGATAHARFGIGATDGVTEGSSAFEDLNGAADANVAGVDKTTKAFMKMNNSTPTVDAEADLASFDVDGFTLSLDDQRRRRDRNPLHRDGAARRHRSEADVVHRGEATTSGVLLQWRTGYEIDNLGFNLYREVDGVRDEGERGSDRGIGPDLGARRRGDRGAQLRALGSRVLPPTAVYWLEDVDFNGKTTLHGPVTPVAGALQCA